MDIVVVVKLSVRQDDASAGLEIEDILKAETMGWQEYKKLLAKRLALNLEGEIVKVKSGIYENLISGVISEVKEIKQRGKILYP